MIKEFSLTFNYQVVNHTLKLLEEELFYNYL
jgi:hypothetical protein